MSTDNYLTFKVNLQTKKKNKKKKQNKLNRHILTKKKLFFDIKKLCGFPTRIRSMAYFQNNSHFLYDFTTTSIALIIFFFTFAVPTDHWIKLKECEEKDKYPNFARELKKTMELTGDN